MNKLLKILETYKLIILILLIALFFRTYDLVGRFEFAHDGDLYSWIVKDIVVNHHPRLIGQLTSADGIYIGPLFYYMLIPFFLLTNMDPVGAIIPITIIGILTVFSYYWVFSKLFNKKVGLISSFLYASLLWPVQFDRHVYPSTLTNLWTIWYFYTVYSIARGNYSIFPLLGILIGLIWHIHIALAPTLIAIPVAFVLSRKLPNLKQSLYFAIALVITSMPLIIFELKHQFLQSSSLFKNFTIDHGGGAGIYKLNLVILKISNNIEKLLLYPQNLGIINPVIVIIGTLLLGILITKKKLMSKNELITLYAWITGVIFFYTFSSTIISEYYFSNVEVIFLGFISLSLYILFQSSTKGKYLVTILFFIILTKNIIYSITENYYHKGYIERKSATEYIKKDSEKKNFPCISVSYITTPGENVGFRYLFWLNNLHVNQPKSGSPVYTIVLPDELAQGKKEQIFGHIKIIPPEQIPSREQIDISCSGQNSNLTDSLFGFTE